MAEPVQNVDIHRQDTPEKDLTAHARSVLGRDGWCVMMTHHRRRAKVSVCRPTPTHFRHKQAQKDKWTRHGAVTPGIGTLCRGGTGGFHLSGPPSI